MKSEGALKSTQAQIEKLEGAVDNMELIYYQFNFFWAEENYKN
ncbi:MAG: hypothetical protein ACOX05_04640 [Bacillota bacterium]|jgi:hypothetical protein